MKERLDFGKYKGERVVDVLFSDQKYLAWAYKNVKSFDWDFDTIKKMISEKLKKDIASSPHDGHGAYDEYEYEGSMEEAIGDPYFMMG